MRERYAEIGSEPTYYSGIDELENKTIDEKISWLEGRFNKTVFVPLEEVRRMGRENNKIWDLNIGVVTLICCAIEALGSFCNPQPDSNELGRNSEDRYRFVRFVEEYMDKRYREVTSGDEKLSEILYGKFRCGLAHGLTIEGHEVADRPREYITNKNGYISIDLWTLFKDFKQAFKIYIEKTKTDEKLKEKFESRFNDIFIKPYEDYRRGEENSIQVASTTGSS